MQKQYHLTKSEIFEQQAHSPFGTCCAGKGCAAQHSVKEVKLQLDFWISGWISQRASQQVDDDLPAVWVVPVEGEAVGEPGVDVVQAHLLAGSIGQGLKSVDYLDVSEKCPFRRPLLLRHHL